MHLIKIEKDKSIVPNEEITYFLNPDYIYIPIKNITVKQNEFIYKKQIIGKNKEYSQVSGKVFGTRKCNIMKHWQRTLVIANDYREYCKNIQNKKISFNIPNLLKLVENDKRLYNLVKSNKKFNNIVISVVNDDPYVYNKIYLLKENIKEILDFLEKLRLLYKSGNNMLIIKNNEAFVIDKCLKVIGSYPSIKLSLVSDEYLLENKSVLKEKLRLDGDTLYLDIKDIVKMINLFKNNKETTKLITISGNNVLVNKVLRVKINTSLKEIIDKFIEIKSQKYDIYINGLLRGFKLDNLNDFIVTEEVEAINIMKKNVYRESKCIKCGKCIAVCPFLVNPVTLENKEKCIQCGLCTYICPCYINLKERLEKR